MLREISAESETAENVDSCATCQISGGNSEDSDESEEDLEESEEDIESESGNSTQCSDDDSEFELVDDENLWATV